MMSAQMLRSNEKNTVMAILIIMVVFYLLTLSPAFAIEPINKTSDGVAIKGYDPVAYFTEGKPVQGRKEFEHVWMGAKWHFSSAEHRDLFSKSPEKYAPRYGGY